MKPSMFPDSPHRESEIGNQEHTKGYPEKALTSDEVIWRYLTFDTKLSSLSYYSDSASASQHRGSVLPPYIDMERYTAPIRWSHSRKSMIIWLSCTATVLTAWAPGAYTSGSDQMMREWHISSVVVALGVTIFTVGFALSPLFLAPFSELSGRRPVFLVTGWLFVISQVICAVTPKFSGMLVGRFLVGCFSSTFNTMVGGVVSDLTKNEDRNNGMALFSCAGLFGTGLGVLVSGFIAQHTTWRWIIYLQIILDVILMICISIFFKETRGDVVLSQKARALNAWYEKLESTGHADIIKMHSSPGLETSTGLGPHASYRTQHVRWKVLADEERGSLLQVIRISLTRPVHMLFTEPVVFFFSLWISFAWAMLYLTFDAIPLVFQTTYGFNLEQADSVFAALMVGAVLSLLLSILQDRLARRHSAAYREIQKSPEGRLVFACVEAALLPIGCVWFGVTGAYSSIPWIVPALGIGCATMGIFSILLAVFSYLADVYHRYASSALAAQNVCRNLVGGAFPLFTSIMFQKMTFQGAGGFLGGCGLLLLAVPWVLLLYGPRIRARSWLASEQEKGEE